MPGKNREKPRWTNFSANTKLLSMIIDRVSSGLGGPSILSGFILALANMIPVIGVMIWNWSVAEIVVVYWVENIIIGVFNVPRMLMAEKTNNPNTPRLFLVPFFLVHFGIFCLVHGFFVFFLLSGDMLHNPFGSEKSSIPFVVPVVGFIFMFLSHLFSFFWNYIGQREYRDTVVEEQMVQPYGRVVVLHIAILFGAFAVVLLGGPLILVLLLIVGKTALDLGFHFYSHSKPEELMTAPAT